MSPILVFRTFLLIVLSDCPRAAPLNESVIQVMRSKRSSGCDEACGVGNSKDKAPLIISGQVVHPQNKYPWVVGLVPKGEKEFFCGGSILNDRFILTAAHCLRTKEAKILKDLGGNQCKTDQGNTNCFMSPQNVEIIFADGSRASVKQLHLEPNFQADEPYSNDIGLLKLSERIQCSENKRPICLPEQGHQLKQDAGSRMIITGWGVVNARSMADSDGKLKEITVTVMDTDECEKHGWAPEQDIKAYCVTSKGTASPCFGDSGGNLFSFNEDENRFYVHGVATAVYSPECNPKVPTLFTAVVPHLNWISKVIS